MPRTVFLDPDGTASDWLGVIVRHQTGVAYQQQCGGTSTELRSAEGYYVPLAWGGLKPTDLTAPFHRGKACLHAAGTPLSPERLGALRQSVEAIAFWTSREEGDNDTRAPLRLDDDRIAELVEAWVPVITPAGGGVLVWPNCD